jgi:hypothetical protein
MKRTLLFHKIPIDNEMKMLKVSIYAAAVIAGFLLALMAPVASADERIFFFGNSLTYYNGGMERMVKALLEEASNTTVEAQASTQNSAKLPRHLQELDGTNGDTAARQALITGNNTSWDLVVLQDQSSVPAYTYSEVWYDSLEAGVELNKLIEPTGAVTMFLHTWGYRDGVDGAILLPDFPSMQNFLDFGYRQYQLAANNPQSFVAPAGIAFQLIFDDTIWAGGTKSNSHFTDLYDGDGVHPSDQGSYLAACVIYAAYTGLPATGLAWKPGPVNAERRDYLQSKADEAVFDDDTFFPSRWDVPGFVGPGDNLEPTEPSVSPPAAPTTSPSISPSASNGNPGLLAAESAAETSTAPRTAGMVMALLAEAAIAWVISMM